MLSESRVKPPVLLVDDDSMIRGVLRIIPRDEGYRIVGEAANGEEAIAQCLRLQPTLVLLDIQMPKMSGLEALAGLREASPQTKILMVNAASTGNSVQEAMQNGASGFVVKPITAANVLSRVAHCLKSDGSPSMP